MLTQWLPSGYLIVLLNISYCLTFGSQGNLGEDQKVCTLKSTWPGFPGLPLPSSVIRGTCFLHLHHGKDSTFLKGLFIEECIESL